MRARRGSGRRRVRLAAGIAGAAMVMLAAFPVAARSVGTFLIASEPAAPADATLLTYSVNSFNRPTMRRAALAEAARRYRDGDSPHVLLGVFLSDDPEFNALTPERTQIAIGHLTRGGVPRSAIEVLPAVTGEHEEALALGAAAAGRGWQRVVVFAPEVRSRRTQGAHKHVGKAIGLEVRVVALDDPDLPLDRWWHTGDGVAAVANEYPRLLYYFVRGRLY
jgi:hypothetical protein